jgi:hypothetical protein
MGMVRVYVAGPIGALDDGRPARLQAAIETGLHLLAAGFAPFVPHLWAASCAADEAACYERWMDYDFAWIGACSAVLRIPGESPGADREVEYAVSRGIQVFYSIEGLIDWRRGGLLR